ncbi:M3 family metallopeptidase [Chitinimonas sp. BJYL2]|uniref:M3 family metallopeptidase n=1 Tax=Chitinimonas sp. BJYL2 TaxID=2976696 RepID=UPI0022B31BE5|nr:M3 family metallopeptidase [Chitinimonas sp. BJYL2]
MPLRLTALFASLMLFVGHGVHAQPANQVGTTTAGNPLLDPSPLPYQLPPFDQIRDEHYGPAFAAAMRAQRDAVTRIKANPARPDFDNTIVALEHAGRQLGDVSNVFFNLSATYGNPRMDALRGELAPKLAAHRDAIMLDTRLYLRVASVYRQRHKLNLDAESLRLVERYHADFLRAGARLPAASKQRLKQLNAELARLENDFGHNVQKDGVARALIVDDKARLAGLSEAEVATAAEAAKARGLPGKYLLALTNTTTQPLAEQLQDRSLRESLYKASMERASDGLHDNQPLILTLVKLRAEKAKLLGFANYAAYALNEQMAQTPGAAEELLVGVAKAAVQRASDEASDLQAEIRRDGGSFKLAPWDWGYYSEKLRRHRYDLGESDLKPYFELDRVLKDGVFYAAERLFGLQFKARPDLPVYQPDVRIYEVSEADGSPLALVVFDFYASDNKRGGAWMNSYVEQSTLFGTKPVAGFHLNIPKPPAGQPTLLTSDELVTLFHEFGHVLHGIFSNVRYPYFSGTNVALDFVEYPSQQFELWAFWPEVLDRYGRHYQTGAAMPTELRSKLVAVRNFNQGFATAEYAAAALLDQRWHRLPAGSAPGDVQRFESQALASAGFADSAIPPRYRSTYFLHTFAGGYSAGYYAYLWADVLAADTSAWFESSGGLTRANGERFRKHILSRGGSQEPMALYRAFRGEAPKLGHLLEKRGLTTTSGASRRRFFCPPACRHARLRRTHSGLHSAATAAGTGGINHRLDYTSSCAAQRDSCPIVTQAGARLGSTPA